MKFETQYFYTALGEITQVQRTIDGQLYKSLYSYDTAGRLKWNKFHSTRSLWRVRDGTGNLTKMTMTFDGQTTTVADNVTHAPFGPLTGLTYGNGLTETTDLALDYRATGQANPSVRDRDYAYDTAGNLTSLTDVLDSSLSQGFGYDALSRLTAETGPNPQTREYSQNGNRTKQITTWTTNYQYDQASNRLIQVGSQAAQTYDAMGNTLTAHDGKHGYSYNQAARLSEFRKDGVLRGEYAYNALGQRVEKKLYDGSGAQTARLLFFYDLDGVLESELRYSAAGQLQHATDYVNLDDKPLAWTRAYYNAQGAIWKKEVYYLHTDQLNTPRLATDGQQTIVWRWDGDGFGDTFADADPDGDGNNVSINLRFPGQYYDSESGLHYNYQRYYDPTTGRYITSDPLGLQAGVNTYLYVSANPIVRIDPLGLISCSCKVVNPNAQQYLPYPHKWCTYSCTCDCPKAGGKDTRDVFGPGTVGPYGSICLGQRDILNEDPNVRLLKGAEFDAFGIDTSAPHEWPESGLSSQIEKAFSDCEGCKK